jgi:hypothetical protein
MTNFYATIIVESEDEQQEFQTDLGRNNISIKVCSPEETKSQDDTQKIHYVLLGNESGYEFLQSAIRNALDEGFGKISGTYFIESIEMGHE